jgi:hypothetical protein|tara:strand:+ start:437 stop:835 length:399 start_codon:yes stop_codon:yes gene_type:complete
MNSKQKLILGLSAIDPQSFYDHIISNGVIGIDESCEQREAKFRRVHGLQDATEEELIAALKENQKLPSVMPHVRETFGMTEEEWDAKEWFRGRQANYPSMGDQLDSLFHAGVFPEEMADKIQKTKDDFPKPE